MNELPRVKQIARGIEILLSYDGAEFCAEHDQIWAGPDDSSAISAAHREELERCGWFVEEDSESWSRFV